MKTYQKILLIAIADAILSQFHLLLPPADFPVSLACAILPIYYFLDRELNPIITGVAIGIVGMLFRSITGMYIYGTLMQGFTSDFTFIYFDLIYGIIFYFMFYKSENRSIYLWFGTIIFADYVANSADYIGRLGMMGYSSDMVMGLLLLVAVMRALIGSFIAIGISKYFTWLKAQENEERYKRLMVIESNLKGEVYFMKKNMDYIEHVMDDAYQLYRDYDIIDDQKKKNTSLNIAKDIHEIKKNYHRVIEGIDGIIQYEQSIDTIKLNDMVKILNDSLSRYIDREKINIRILIEGNSEIPIVEHYILMSVLRNLVMNGIEAIKSENGKGTVTIGYKEVGEDLVFSIKDTGKGIKTNLIDIIFNPGFSTKYDEETGNASRGLGLSLVKEIVEDKFNGKIEVESELGKGSIFTAKIPRKSL